MKLLKPFVLASFIVAAASGSVLADPAPAASATPDSIVVLAKHAEAKPDDPVKVNFEKFKVTKTSFDPKKIEGGKASIEIDATSLKTGIDKRDAHLNTPDFLDTAKYATIKIDIDGVKKKADKTYTANATVNFRGVTKKYPVTFNVTDQQADSIHIHAEQTFQRSDFNVGKVSTDPKVAPVVNDLTLQMELTLKKA